MPQKSTTQMSGNQSAFFFLICKNTREYNAYEQYTICSNTREYNAYEQYTIKITYSTSSIYMILL